MEADAISLHDPVVQIDEEEMPSNSAPSQSDSISDGASQGRSLNLCEVFEVWVNSIVFHRARSSQCKQTELRQGHS